MKLWVVYLYDYEASYTIGVFSSYEKAHTVMEDIGVKLEDGNGRINGWLYKSVDIMEMTLDKEALLQ